MGMEIRWQRYRRECSVNNGALSLAFGSFNTTYLILSAAELLVAWLVQLGAWLSRRKERQ